MTYHLLWCPKYRQQALVGDVTTALEDLIRPKVNQIG
ncbi:transposase [Candidatus Hakubella thermalkaliphila]